jgi:hypothetical protein
MFVWHENSRIAVVLRIEIVTVQPNVNMLFRNSENNYYSAIPRGDIIIVILLNSPFLFQTNNPNNISIIQNNIIFLLSSR